MSASDQSSSNPLVRPSAGLHHITAICGNPADNRRVCTDTLGLRMIKKTVNFDDLGFMIDESVAELGQILRLPGQYEAHRQAIEANLAPLL